MNERAGRFYTVKVTSPFFARRKTIIRNISTHKVVWREYSDQRPDARDNRFGSRGVPLDQETRTLRDDIEEDLESLTITQFEDKWKIPRTQNAGPIT